MHFIYSYAIAVLLMWCACSQRQSNRSQQSAPKTDTVGKDTLTITTTNSNDSINSALPDSNRQKPRSPQSKNQILKSALNTDKFNVQKWLSSDHSFPSPLHPGKISRFDGIIKKMARRYGFDWRLIAAQIYVESTFDTSAQSHAGAQGLMQIMPGTSRYLGYDPSLMHDPKVNIAVGCLYDHKLFLQWKKELKKNKEQRLAFALASFNAGRSRVLRSLSQNDSSITWDMVHAHLPIETQNYVHKIALKHNAYSRCILP